MLICDGGAKGEKALRRHCFDMAAAGYVNLAPPSQSFSGDSREAVRARTRFLDSGAYAPIKEALCRAVADYAAGGLVVDAGCGEGYYTSAVAECAEAVFGFDLSKAGAESGAKRLRRQGLANGLFAVAGIYDIPLSDASADAVLSVFAPCAEAEFLRILKPGGVLIIAGAGEEHLMGLKEAIYRQTYKNADRADAPESLAFVERRRVSYELTLTEDQAIADLFSMTPYYYRTSREDMEKVRALTRVTTAVDVFLDIYRKA